MGSGHTPHKHPSDNAKKTKVVSATRKKLVAKLTGVLATIVVLCTAWALMVPALSITQDNARPERGFFDGGAQQPTATAGPQLVAGVAPALTTGDVAPAMPAVTLEQEVVTSDGETVRVVADAEAGTLSEGATMQVAEVTDADVVDTAIEAAADGAEMATGDTRAIALAVEFVDADGNRIEPAGQGVHMTMETSAIASTSSLAVVAVDDAQTAQIVDSQQPGENAERAENAEGTGAADSVDVVDSVDAPADESATSSVTFEVASSSTYAIVYTVDFHWEVDGKTFEFSLPGGGFVNLEKLVEVLGIAEGDAVAVEVAQSAEDAQAAEGEQSAESAQVAARAQAFVADVEKVEFSNPDLVWVGRADYESTVGALKENNSLDVEYSAELTEEQIAAINAQTVEAGDWALISMRPFTSEETLTVTMKDGERFTIGVTDASYGIQAITNLDGATGALVNTARKNAVQSAAHSTSGRLQATGVNIDVTLGNVTTTDSSAQLTKWTFAKVGDSGNNYTIRSDAGYLNINGSNVSVSQTPQTLRIDTNSSNQIRVISGDYALNNWGSNTSNGYGAYNNLSYTTNPDEWFTVYALGAPNVSHVTVHYVDRNGNVLTGVQYSGSNSDVFDNGDGTFTIPYDISGSVDLRSEFSKEGYTYANTHLAGIDASETELTYDGYMIDSVLSIHNEQLSIWSDTGETSYNWMTENPDVVLGNRAYGSLKPYALSSEILARPSNNGSKRPYATSNNKDIYVVLDPVPTNASAGGAGSLNPADVANPTLEKTMESNGDGTYTLSLKVDAHAGNASDTNKANVLFVVDTSSSMRNITTSNKRNRIMDTHDAVLDLGERLLSYNASHPGAVEVSMITFDGAVNERLDWTTDKSAFQEAANEYLRYYYLHTGTDWEDSLKGALQKLQAEATDDDPTFVIFFTDGEPSQYTNFHGAGTNSYTDPTGVNISGNEQISGSYPNFYSYFLSREASKDEMRAIVNEGAMLYGIYAYNSTNQSYNGYNGAEDGAKMLHNAIKYGYNTDQDLKGNLFYEAKNTNDLQGAFDKIFNLITESVGFTNVVVEDGIAAGVTSSTVVDGDVSGFTYVIKDKNGVLAYKVTVAPNGVPDGQTATDGTPIFTIGEEGTPVIGEKKLISTKKIKTGQDGNPVLDNNGKIQTEDENVEVYYYKDGNDKEYIMPISTTGVDVTWDLSPLGILKDGYSYEVSFVVWPNQEAYDLVADLNNGKRPDLEAVAHWDSQPVQTDADGNRYRQGGFTNYPYISRYEETGIYSAMSNTKQTMSFYKADRKIVNGQEVTEYTGPTSTPINPPGPMPLTAAYSEIEKQWNVERDPGILAQYLYNANGTSKEFKIDFDVYQGSGSTPYTTASLGWDAAANNGQGAYVWSSDSPMKAVTYAGHQYEIGTRWSQDFSIATGLMLSEAKMEARGLNKSHYPSAVFGETTYYILEEGHDYTIREQQVGTIGYEFDFTPPVYHPMLVDGVLQSVDMSIVKDNEGNIQTVSISDMTDNETGLSSLLIENTLRGYIHLNKRVVDRDDVHIPSDSTKFQYTVELNSTTNPGPFVGDHIPWYGINGLFYHDAAFNYYQVDKAEGDVWKLKDEKGGMYDVTSTGFNPDLAEEQSVTYKISDSETKTVQLFGNRTMASNDGKTATATLWINQNEVLNIANVPVGTTYTITESNNDSYELSSILKEIKDGSTVESSENVDDLTGRKIEGTIVANRDNNITFTNKVKEGALKLTKVAQVDGSTPNSDQHNQVDGDYTFKVTNAENNAFGIEKYVQITVTDGVAVLYKVADSEEALSSAESKQGSWAVLSGLAEGDYVITETDERNGLLLTEITRGDGNDDVVDVDNGKVIVHVKAEDTAASQSSAQATFTNNYYNNDGPDRITLDIEKVFEGLVFESDIPNDFRVVVSFTTAASDDPLEIELKRPQDETVELGEEHIKVKETTNGYTLRWHITNLPADAANFQIKEANFDPIAGYTFTAATLDGSDITRTAAGWHNVSVTAPTATLSDVTGQRKTSDSGHNLKFVLEDNDILLSKLTVNQGTMVISKRSLNTLEREAIKQGNGWPQQGGFSKEKIHFFSLEEHPSGFKFGGKTITFGEENGKTTVSFSHNASAQEYVYTVTYGIQSYLNNAALKNTYVQNLVTLELIKVDANGMSAPLKNAQFTLKKLDPDGTGSYLSGAEDKVSGETDANGKASISDIASGYYEVSETKVPAGYVLVDEGKFYIKVSGGTIKQIVKTDDDQDTTEINKALVKNWPEQNGDSGNVQFVSTRPAISDNPETTDVDETSQAVTTFRVGNLPGSALPKSGGPGTILFMILGLALIAGAGLLLWRRRRIG